LIAAVALSLLVWAYLLAAHGRFWQAGPTLAPDKPAATPPIAVRHQGCGCQTGGDGGAGAVLGATAIGLLLRRRRR
jgi:MYXO-CTERM domain-containing protein